MMTENTVAEVQAMAPEPAVERAVAKVDPHVVAAKALVITSAELYLLAGDMLTGNKALQAEVKAGYAVPKKKTDEAHKAVVAEEKKRLGPLLEAETHLKSIIRSWDDKQEEIRQAEQRRLQAIADAEAERERAALAKRMEAAKKPETVERLAAEYTMVVAPVIAVQSAAPKIAGVHRVEVWKWKVIDAALIPRDYLLVDEKTLNGLARALKEKANVPGIQFFRDTTLSARGN